MIENYQHLTRGAPRKASQGMVEGPPTRSEHKRSSNDLTVLHPKGCGVERLRKRRG